MKKLDHKKTKISLLFALLILVVMAVAVVSADNGKMSVNETAVSIVQYEKAEKLTVYDEFEFVENAENSELASYSSKTTATFKSRSIPSDGGYVSFGYGWSD